MLPVVNAVWIGKTMGRTHAACLQSFLQTDHTVILHAYGKVEDAPRGVQYRDANVLLPEDRLLRYANNGSYAISSNLMRYQVLKRGLGLYVDCDVFCLRPIEDSAYLYGRESTRYVNTAVMKLQPDSPVLADLCAMTEGWIPPWLFAKTGTKALKPLNEYPWGTTGPHALTHYLKKHDLETLAAPPDVFYPVPPDRWALLYDPALRISDVVTSRTRYVHLYNEMARRGAASEPPSSSPLGRMIGSTRRSLVSRVAGRLARSMSMSRS